MALNFFKRKKPSGLAASSPIQPAYGGFPPFPNTPSSVTSPENRVTDISSSAVNQNNIKGSAYNDKNWTFNPYSNDINVSPSYYGFPSAPQDNRVTDISSSGAGQAADGRVWNDNTGSWQGQAQTPAGMTWNAYTGKWEQTAAAVAGGTGSNATIFNDSFQPSSVSPPDNHTTYIGFPTVNPSYGGFPGTSAGAPPTYGGFPSGPVAAVPTYGGFPGPSGGVSSPSYGGFPLTGVTADQQHRFDISQAKSQDMMATPSYGGFPSHSVMAFNDTLSSGSKDNGSPVAIPATSQSDVDKFIQQLAANPSGDIKPPQGVTVNVTPGQPATVSFQGQNWTVYPVPTSGSAASTSTPLPISPAVPAALSGAETQRDVNTSQTTHIDAGLSPSGKLIDPHIVGSPNHNPYSETLAVSVPDPVSSPLSDFHPPSIASAQRKSEDMFAVPATPTPSPTPPITSGPTFTVNTGQHFGDVTAGGGLSALDPGTNVHHMGRASMNDL